ncbi:hypothetical protein EVAR_17773_1 [Eumeta japonica]|uniref:Uncharacterized protein n=1 Tax=Eumeta variegata TaxID=151549 RepID=A0A4C1TTD3_EUMVA|nr:hypothetical protein EVAR_17773_1 [Eumeta japonica]
MHFRCCSVGLSYRSLLEKCNLLDLSSTRLQLGAMMLYDLCHNKYDIAALYKRHVVLSCSSPSLERKARPYQLYAVDRCRTVAGTRSPMRRLVYTCNTRFNININTVDIIALTVGSFKTIFLIP